MLSKIFFEENKFLLGIFILITFSFLYSLNIYLFVYDGHHHGLVFSNAIDLLEGRKPYSEIWIQYGFLTTLIHSIVILIFGKQLLFLNIFTIIIYLTSIFFISLTVRKLTNNFYSFLIFFIIISNHPVPWLPWPNYIALLFMTMAVYFLQFKNIKSHYLAGFCLGLVCLSRENYFIFIFPFILFLFISPLLFKNRNLLYKKAFNILFGFLIPISFFFIYLVYNGLIVDWYKYLILPFIYVDSILNTTIFDLIINFIVFFLSSSIFNFISQPQYLFIGLILISSTVYIFHSLFISNNRDINILTIAFLCLSSSVVSINYELFRLYTSVIIGSILLIYLIFRIKDLQIKVFLIIFLSSISFYSISFYPEGNNKIFENIDKKNSYEFNQISYFKNQKWVKNKTDSLLQIYNLQKDIKKNCSIEYAANFTFDAFYFLALESKNIHIMPMIRAGDLNKSVFQDRFFRSKSFLDKIKTEINNQNLIILINENNYYLDGYKLNFDDVYSIKEIPLHNKDDKPNILRLYYPNVCLN